MNSNSPPVSSMPEPHLRQSSEATDLSGPPRAPLAFRVGVTGHRPDPKKRPDPNVSKLREIMRKILLHIASAFDAVADTHTQVFDCQACPIGQARRGALRIISGLAAGADQWAAEEAVALGYELQAPLPFPREDYRIDFAGDLQSETVYDDLLKKATAILELDGKIDFDRRGRRLPDSRSYEALGRAVLDQSDLLLAIWDGKDAKGKGGAGQVVREALQRGIPVVWIPWTDPDHWQMLEPHWHPVERLEDVEEDWVRLTNRVCDLLVPPALEPSILPEFRSSLREQYFREHPASFNIFLGWWLLFRDVICGDFFSVTRLRSWITLEPFRMKKAAIRNAPDELWKTRDDPDEPYPRCHPIGAGFWEWVSRVYSPHFAWSNSLSVYYANLYRSSFVLNYLLAAMAVFFALLCVATGRETIYGLLGAPLELALIFVVLLITYLGRSRRWHERWIDYRTLAERLRLARFLILFGGGGQQVSVPGHLASYGNPSSTWMHWHFRAVERAAGLPTAVFDQPYLSACRELWLENLIEDQKRYHASIKRLFHRLDHNLHIAGVSLFFATFVACLAHIMIDHFVHAVCPSPLEGFLILAAAFLPALGAASAAIRSQGEFHRVSQRSAAMEERLAKLQLDLASVPIQSGELSSVRLRECAGKVADLMINEMLDWRVVFQERPLGLPG